MREAPGLVAWWAGARPVPWGKGLGAALGVSEAPGDSVLAAQSSFPR